MSEKNLNTGGQEPTNEEVKKSTDEDVEKSTDENVEKSTNEVVEKTTDELVEKSTNEIVSPSTDEVVNPSTDEDVEKTTDKVVEKTTDELVEKSTNEIVSPSTDEIVSPSTDEVVSPSTDEVVNPSTDEDVEKTTDKVVEKTTDELVEKSTNEVVSSSTDEAVNPSTDRVVETATDETSRREELSEKLREFEVNYSVLPFYQRNPDVKRESLLELYSIYKTYRFEPFFVPILLETESPVHLGFQLLGSWDSVKTEYSLEYKLANFLFRNMTEKECKFSNLFLKHPELLKTVSTIMENLKNMTSWPQISLMFDFCKCLSYCHEGRKAMLLNGFPHVVSQMAVKYPDSPSWLKDVGIFQNIVDYCKQQVDYGDLCEQLFKMSLVKKIGLASRGRMTNFTWHYYTCFMSTVFELVAREPTLRQLVSSETNPQSNRILQILGIALKILDDNPNYAIQTGAVLDALLGEDYRGLKIKYGDGGISRQLFEFVIESDPHMKNLFHHEFIPLPDHPEHQVIAGSTFNFSLVKSEAEGVFQVDYMIKSCSKFLFLSFPEQVTLEPCSLEIKHSEEGKCVYTLTAFNTKTIAGSMKHSTLYTDSNGSWVKLSGGFETDVKPNFEIGNSDWSLWTANE